MGTRRRWFLALAGAWLITLAGASGQDATQNGSAYHAFVGARVLDATGAALVNATVLVRDGKVTAIGPAASVTPPRGSRTTNLAGKVIVPGWISAHAHVSDVDGLRPRAYTEANTVRQLGVFARYGITTVWSLGGEQAPAFAARESQGTPALARARIFVSGDVIGGATPDAAREAVTRVAALRPDIIKIRVDDNLGAGTKMAPEVYRAVIDEAHRRGLRVAAHIFYLDDAKDLLRAGVDMIAHSVRDRDIDDEFISLMRTRDVPYCPTLTRELATFVYESTPTFFADPFFTREADKDVMAQLLQPARQEAMRKSTSAQRYKAGLDVAKRNLKRASDAGLLVVMGTDSGAFPERFEGYFEHLEMEMMVEAGLTPAAVLKSATIDAARAMKVEAIGTLAVGRWADFVVLDRNPLDDIRHTRSISSVWIAGNSVKR
jgi:imidazolonepropionase-like amidohydrolase